ncbi:MAG: zinc ribbon domain-containing protein [Candidatus Riflebacteria bacterium]|nr:zinc ribbon domain-containing protein [Candidatus Riflebacteria bacterium]
MENKCPACGFVNPEGAGYCFLCGVPFITSQRGQAASPPKPPSRVKGDSQEVDAKDLPDGLSDDDSGAARTQEELLRDLARMVPDGGCENMEDLDSLLSDYDGSSRPSITASPKPGQPVLARPVPVRATRVGQAGGSGRSDPGHHRRQGVPAGTVDGPAGPPPPPAPGLGEQEAVAPGPGGRPATARNGDRRRPVPSRGSCRRRSNL